MHIGRIGLRLLRIAGVVVIDLENQAGKDVSGSQPLLCAIDKCMAGEQAGVNGLDCLLDAGRYVDPLLPRTFGLSFRI